MNVRRLTLLTLATALGVLALSAGPAFAYKEYFKASSFGEPCSSEPCGKGQFSSPAGVAVNDSTAPLTEPAAGDVYVIDGGDERVERFSSTGAYLGQFNGGGSYEAEGVVKAGPATPAGSFSGLAFVTSQGVAIDNNPLDTSAGDIYVMDYGHGVIDRFSAEGKYEDQLTGTCENPNESAVEPGACPGSTAKKVIPFKSKPELNGVAVDSAGDLWVYNQIQVAEFSDTGVFMHGFSTGIEEARGLAVDSSGNVYPVVRGTGKVAKFEAGGDVAEFGAGVNALAINPTSGEVLVDEGFQVEQFAPIKETEPVAIQTFSGLSGSHGIAVNGASGVLYASQIEADNVELFDYIAFPSPETEPPSGVGETGATLHGTVNPEGVALTECYFEYGTETSYGQKEPCKPTPAEIGEGTKPVAVSAEVSGLGKGAIYHFRLVTVNANGSSHGTDKTLFTATHPAVESESVPSSGSAEATLGAVIDAEGLPSSYHVEYGPSAAYGSSTPEVSIGAGTSAAPVLVRLGSLQPGTQYHFRFVAKNGLGVGEGKDVTFITTASASASASVLPDNRAYELVSSPTENQTVDSLVGVNHGTSKVAGDEESYQPDQASADGNSVAYPGSPALEGGSGTFGDSQSNEWVATRGSTGWATSDVTPPGTDPQMEYAFFSSDLSAGIFFADDAVNISASPAAPPGCKFGIYSRGSDGSYHSLIVQPATPGMCGYPQAADASSDRSHVLFEDEAALTAGAEKGFHNLYDSVDSHLYQVNILPDGRPEPAPSAWLGSPQAFQLFSPDFSNAVSADGSRVFWTSTERGTEGPEQEIPKALYVRENDTQPQSSIGPGGECTVSSDACTVQVDAGEPRCVAEGKCKSGSGLFWTASTDGSKVLFTDANRLTVDSTAEPGEPDLYEYEVNTGLLTDLTAAKSGHANVQGVIGTSDDGEYIYFAANGVLASNENASKETAQKGHEEGQPNIYLRHNGVTTFVAAGGASFQALYGEYFGDWSQGPNNRTAEVTPDGHHMVFETNRPLTGYDNQGMSSVGVSELDEVFVYDALTGRISCASCNPSGAAPSEPVESTSSSLPVPGGGLPHVKAYMPRWISDNGSRVFFETNQPLVSQDTNGLLDVYEWERPASGAEANNSCTRSAPSFSEVNGGCVYLLSGGQSPDDSFFADADAEGNNVFFTSRGQLTAQAGDENVAMYDARVNGGFPELETVCTGTGCQGVPPAPPIFATPSSVTFNGVGNFPPSPPAVKSKPKSAKCKKGFARKHNKCVGAKKRTRKSKRSIKSSRGGKK
ncbi:MAG: hypothetical protein ACRDLF_06830 [Solirubrobacteraceae bacterium]